MTPRRKLMLWITGALTAVAVLGPAFYYTQVVRPVRAFEELCLSEEKVDPQRIRDAAHQALRWQIHHDALVSLTDVADESSIPVLMRSLRRVSPPNEDGLMICTTAHCFEALRMASGRDVRNTVDAWEDWYRNHRKHGSPPLTMKERAAALVTEGFVAKHVTPISAPIALAAHQTTQFDHALMDANKITAIEILPLNGDRTLVYEDPSKRPPNDGMVTSVPNARGIGFYYPATSAQPFVEVRVNHNCDVFGGIAVNLVVPNPLVLAEQSAQVEKRRGATARPWNHRCRSELSAFYPGMDPTLAVLECQGVAF